MNLLTSHLFQSSENDSFQCLPAEVFQVPPGEVSSWLCWKFCFLCFCVPVCYPCYLSRTLRRRNVRGPGGPGLNFKYQQTQIKRISPEKKTRESEIRFGLLQRKCNFIIIFHQREGYNLEGKKGVFTLVFWILEKFHSPTNKNEYKIMYF